MQPVLPSNSVFADQPSILILPPEVMNHIFTNVTEEKDLVSFRITCRTLSRMNLLPDTQIRIFCFKTVSTKLIEAINKRVPNKQECAVLGIPLFKYINLAQQEKNAQAKAAEEKFFRNFKTGCLLFNLTDKDACFNAVNISKIINKKARSQIHYKDSKHLIIKLKTMKTNFQCNIFENIAQTYASQPITMISPDSFEKKKAELVSCFPNTSNIVSYQLCKAIRARHSEAIEILSTAYLDLTPNTPKIEELKLTLQAELEKSKTALDMTEEKLYEIETKLANIDATVQMEAKKLSLFYKGIGNI